MAILRPKCEHSIAETKIKYRVVQFTLLIHSPNSENYVSTLSLSIETFIRFDQYLPVINIVSNETLMLLGVAMLNN